MRTFTPDPRLSAYDNAYNYAYARPLSDWHIDPSQFATWCESVAVTDYPAEYATAVAYLTHCIYCGESFDDDCQCGEPTE